MITGFRIRRKGDREISPKGKPFEPTNSEQDAAWQSVSQKLRDIGIEKFEAMTEQEYADWINGLPLEEFIALMNNVTED